MPNYNQAKLIMSFTDLEYYARREYIIVSPVDLRSVGPFEVHDLEFIHLPLFAIKDENKANDWISANVEYDGNLIGVFMRKLYMPYKETQVHSASKLVFSSVPGKNSLQVTVMYPMFIAGKEAYWIGSHTLNPKIYGKCGAAVSLAAEDFIIHYSNGTMYSGSSMVAVRNREEAELWFESRFTPQCTNIRATSSMAYMPLLYNTFLPVYLNDV